MFFYTYILRSIKNNKLYVGWTKDLRRRFAEHNDGKVNSTRYRGPFVLIYYEACLNEVKAKKREKYFKSGYGRKFLKMRI